MKRKTLALLLALCSIAALLGGCATGDTTPAATTAAGTTAQGQTTAAADTTAAAIDPEAAKYGGVIKATLNADPVSLDAGLEGGETEQIPAAHIFETALTADISGDIFPGVCTYEFDGTTLTLTVRDGVTFHDGSAVEATDVEASMTRWLTNNSFGRNHFGNKLDKAEISGNSIICTFKESAPLALTAIARYSQGLYVMPKEICEKYPEEKLSKEDYIGTGPYKFVEHLADRYVLVERYEAYIATDVEADGLAAPKKAYADQIYFYPVSDKTTRITGVQTGEYDIAVGVTANMIDTLSADPNLKIEIMDLGIMPVMIFNSAEGLGTDINLRNAIIHCLNMEELLIAAQGGPDLYYLNPSLVPKVSRYWTDIDLGKYNNVDLVKAQEYLDASNYKGEALRFITTTDNDYFYKTAMVVAERVKAIGIVMDVQVYDNPTLRQYRDDQTKYDIFSGGLGYYDDPVLISLLSKTWAGFYDNAEKDEFMTQIANESDYETRYALWEKVTEILYTDLPVISFGERRSPTVFKSTIHDIFETTQKIYWNTWIEH